MTHLRDDPQLTAYALGELEGEEAAAIERRLEGDAAARDEVEAIRALGTRLEADLASAPAPVLGADLRARLAAAAGRPAGRRWAWGLAAAAAIFACVGVGLFLAQPPKTVTVVDSAAREDAEVRVREAADGLEVARRDREVGRAGGPVDVSEPEPPTSEATLETGLTDFVPPTVQLVGPDTVSDEEHPLFGAEAGEPVRPGSDPSASNRVVGNRVVAVPSLKARWPQGDAVQKNVEVPPVDLPRVSPGTEGYDEVRDNAFVRVVPHDDDTSTSTFSVDVDTASYANVRRFLQQMGRLPPKGAVRIEELVNYFAYDYAPPAEGSGHPFAFHTAVAACPWAPDHRLVRVALKGKVVSQEERPAANLVFLLDVSGSMRPANKLPLVKQALRMLIESLREDDRVAIVVYAGAAGLVLPSTAGSEQATIHGALDQLGAGGSTNGGAGIELAYAEAAKHFVEGGVNRVVLCTDGDFNVGVSDRSALVQMIKAKAKSGVYLSVLGFGMGNVKDGFMEELSNKGNGNYAYVDSIDEAKKVFVDEGLGMLVTIAKDVKVQVFFNPAQVAGWRLIGYENRVLARQDFNDDTKDAGEIGAGHTVTALYEVVPAGQPVAGPAVDPNPFVAPPEPPARPSTESAAEIASNALLRLRLRYKQPDQDTSTLLEEDLVDEGRAFDLGDPDFQHAAAVAAFGMMLRDSPHKGQCSWPLVEEIAVGAQGEDPNGRRAEFLDLVRKAASLAR